MLTALCFLASSLVFICQKITFLSQWQSFLTDHSMGKKTANGFEMHFDLR